MKLSTCLRFVHRPWARERALYPSRTLDDLDAFWFQPYNPLTIKKIILSCCIWQEISPQFGAVKNVTKVMWTTGQYPPRLFVGGKGSSGGGLPGVLRLTPQDARFLEGKLHFEPWRYDCADGLENRLVAIVAIVPLLVGCGGPHVWDYKIFTPKEADLVGTYKVARFYRDVDAIADFSRKDPIQIVLNSDQTAEVVGFPEFDVLADGVLCKVTESGTWKLGRGPEPQVHFHLRSVPKVDAGDSPFGRQCTADFDLSILGHFTPYKLYWSFGGPDVDRGIEFERASR